MTISASTDVHTNDTALLVKEAQAAGEVGDDRDPQLLALGVVGAVAHFTHFHRTGRIDLDVDALAAFVGAWVTAALTA